MDVEDRMMSVLRYVSFDPYVLFLNSIAVDSSKDVRIYVSIDGSSHIIQNDATATGGLDVPMQFHQLVEKSLVIEAKSNTGMTISDVAIRLNVTASRYPAFERLFYGGYVSKREQMELEEASDTTLVDMILNRSSTEWLYTREVSKHFSGLAVSENPSIGNIMDTPHLETADGNVRGTQMVLLGISCDRSLATGACSVSVTRGESETDYINLDCRALPDLAYTEGLYIPARDSIELYYKNNAVTSGNIKFRYGVKPLTIRDKLRWGVNLLDFEEDIIESLLDRKVDIRRMCELGQL